MEVLRTFRRARGRVHSRHNRSSCYRSAPHANPSRCERSIGRSMSTHRFYPHRVGVDRILLTVEPIKADVPRGGDGSLQLYKTELEKVTLRVSAAVPDGILDEVLIASQAERRRVQVH